MAHLPYYNSKAHEIPSVTQIISLLNKKGLMDWSNWLGFQRIKYRAFLDEKALLGTLVHNKIECDINQTHYSPHIDYKLEREADVRFNYYLQWKRDCKVEPKYSELRLHNERYEQITTCRIVCFTGKPDVPIVSKAMKVEEMVDYRTAFEKLYEAFKLLNTISIDDWKGSLI